MGSLSFDTVDGLREAEVYMRDAIKTAFPWSGQREAFRIALRCVQERRRRMSGHSPDHTVKSEASRQSGGTR